eukprot:TRINITY_DN1332_c1_g1_i1.p1 TRINITY_DN1332_c1_g1~~TRINITY_DN1332_c1_g1_i1.p1  ORF type:complete len:415 (-),score=65.40 TRINITY_DN1332_c1_g1_i1:181-1425(-)
MLQIFLYHHPRRHAHLLSKLLVLFIFFVVDPARTSELPLQAAEKFPDYGGITSAGAADGRFPPVPSFAYALTGGRGDCGKMKRLLQALYHPRNVYLLHMDMVTSAKERLELARYIRLDSTFQEVKNVHLISRSNLVTYRGVTMVSTYLHCASMLLRLNRSWDWFILLSASDYPVVRQDDLLHVFSYVPRHLNFVENMSKLGWKLNARAVPILIDTSIFSKEKQAKDLIWTEIRRPAPNAFKLFTGSAWVVLSREFIEYVIVGWDNLPRMMLAYFTNFLSSPEGYFQTLICNSAEFMNTTVNHDLHFIPWDIPPKQHPRSVTLRDFNKIMRNGVAFARKFDEGSEVLEKIDRAILHRMPGHFTPGGWCLGEEEDETDPCWQRGPSDVLLPAEGSQRLQSLLLRLLQRDGFTKHCN